MRKELKEIVSIEEATENKKEMEDFWGEEDQNRFHAIIPGNT